MCDAFLSKKVKIPFKKVKMTRLLAFMELIGHEILPYLVAGLFVSILTCM